MSAIQQQHFASAESAALGLAEAVANALRAGLQGQCEMWLAVSGGRSPIAFFTALSAQDLPWSRVVVSLVDERWVPADHADSNEHLVRQHLLQGPAAAARFVALKTAAAMPALACDERSQAIRWPLDVVVLGMGEDGHTASLFPQAPGLDAALDAQGAAMLAAIDPPHAPYARLTLTLAAICAAKQVFLAIQGAQKQKVLAAALAGDDFPIARVLSARTAAIQIFLADVAG